MVVGKVCLLVRDDGLRVEQERDGHLQDAEEEDEVLDERAGHGCGTRGKRDEWDEVLLSCLFFLICFERQTESWTTHTVL